MFIYLPKYHGEKQKRKHDHFFPFHPYPKNADAYVAKKAMGPPKTNKTNSALGSVFSKMPRTMLIFPSFC